MKKIIGIMICLLLLVGCFQQEEAKPEVQEPGEKETTQMRIDQTQVVEDIEFSAMSLEFNGSVTEVSINVKNLSGADKEEFTFGYELWDEDGEAIFGTQLTVFGLEAGETWIYKTEIGADISMSATVKFTLNPEPFDVQ